MNRILNRELVSLIAAVSLAIMAMSVIQPVMPLYLTSIGITPAMIGLMNSLAMVGMVFGESTGGWLADRIGIRIPLSIGTIFCIPVLLLFTFTQNTPFILTLFLLWGTLRAGVFGPGRGYIGKTVPLTHRATYLAVYAASMSVSRSIGSFIGGFVGEHLGYDYNFYFAAGIVLLGGLLVIIALRKIPFINPALPAPVTPKADNTTVKAPYRSRAFLSQCGIAVMAWLSMGVGSFLPLLAADVTGVKETEIGLLFTISALVGAASTIPMGRMSDRRNKKIMMITGLLVTAAGLTGIAFAGNYGTLIAALIIQSIGQAIFGPAAVAMLSETVPANWQGTAMGIYGGFEDIGVVIGSALAGIVWEKLGPQSAFLVLGTAPPVIAALMALTLLKNKKNPALGG
jgi:MFS transporter, PPP family, 3-phenylpropionic acid transporter